MTTSHGSVHVDVDGHIDDPLHIRYPDGGDMIGIRITSSRGLHVWLSGTPDELHAFASEIHRHTNRAVRELLRPPSPDVAADPVVIPAAPVEDAA